MLQICRLLKFGCQANLTAAVNRSKKCSLPQQLCHCMLIQPHGQRIAHTAPKISKCSGMKVHLKEGAVGKQPRLEGLWSGVGVCQ